MSFANYQLSLPASSGTWTYSPSRRGPAEQTWNASYTGETSWTYARDSRSGPYGRGFFYFRTQATGSRVGMDFAGTGFRLCFKDNGATYTVSLDSTIINPTVITNDVGCNELGTAQAIVIQDLDFAAHTVDLLVTGSFQDFQFFGGILETKILVDSQSSIVSEKIIDDRDDGWDILRQPGSAWDKSTKLGLYQSTDSYTCIWTDSESGTATYTFKGASAVLLNSSGGDSFTVILDGQAITSSIETPNWNMLTTPLFFQTNLDPAQSHTITVMNYNPSDRRCKTSDCCLGLDSLQLFGSNIALEGGPAPSLNATAATSSVAPGTSQPASTPQIKGSSLNVAAVACGVVAGCVIVAFAFFVFVVLCRRRKRKLDQSTIHNYQRAPFAPSSHPPTDGLSAFGLSTSSQGRQLDTWSSPFGPSMIVSQASPPANFYDNVTEPSISTAAHPSKGEQVFSQRDDLLVGPSGKVMMLNTQTEMGVDSLPPYSAIRHGRTEV